MNLRTRAALVIVLASLLSACAGPLHGMKEVPESAVAVRPAADKAAVVFLRPSDLGWAIGSSVFELRPDQDRFIGIVSAHKKLVYYVQPGHVRFLVISEATDFIQADLDAGKTYYVLVTPRIGLWKARFSLRPVESRELDGAEFKGWFEKCVWIDTTDDVREWARRNWSDVQNKKIEYLQKWEPRTDKPTLKATDGR